MRTIESFLGHICIHQNINYNIQIAPVTLAVQEGKIICVQLTRSQSIISERSLIFILKYTLLEVITAAAAAATTAMTSQSDMMIYTELSCILFGN